MPKLTHAQFRDWLQDNISDLNIYESDYQQGVLDAYICASEEFNKIPDIGAELESIIDSALDMQPADPSLKEYGEGFKGALNFIKDKIKELKK